MSEVFSDIQVNFQQARRQIQEMHRALSTTRESNAVLIDGSLEAIEESRKLLRDAQD